MIAEKLRAAGLKSSADRLTELAREVARSHRDYRTQAMRYLRALGEDGALADEAANDEAFCSAVLAHMRRVAGIRDDGGASGHGDFVSRILDAAPAVAAEGQDHCDTQVKSVLGSNSTGASPDAARDQNAHDNHSVVVSRGTSPGASRAAGETRGNLLQGQSLRVSPAKPSTVTPLALGRLAARFRDSRFGYIRVDGISVFETKPEAAMGWAETRRRESKLRVEEARFVEFLCANAPDLRRTIGDQISVEDIERAEQFAGQANE